MRRGRRERTPSPVEDEEEEEERVEDQGSEEEEEHVEGGRRMTSRRPRRGRPEVSRRCGCVDRPIPLARRPIIRPLEPK